MLAGEPKVNVFLLPDKKGRIEWHGRGYHNHGYIFPVGFRSRKLYNSTVDTIKQAYYLSEILDGGDHPIVRRLSVLLFKAKVPTPLS